MSLTLAPFIPFAPGWLGLQGGVRGGQSQGTEEEMLLSNSQSNSMVMMKTLPCMPFPRELLAYLCQLLTWPCQVPTRVPTFPGAWSYTGVREGIRNPVHCW